MWFWIFVDSFIRWLTISILFPFLLSLLLDMLVQISEFSFSMRPTATSLVFSEKKRVKFGMDGCLSLVHSFFYNPERFENISKFFV